MWFGFFKPPKHTGEAESAKLAQLLKTHQGEKAAENKPQLFSEKILKALQFVQLPNAATFIQSSEV